MDDAFTKPGATTNLCETAQQIATNIETWVQYLSEANPMKNSKGWVVFLGTDGLLTNRIKIGSRHNHEPGSYMRYKFASNNLDVEVFLPRKEANSPPEDIGGEWSACSKRFSCLLTT